MRPTGIGQGFLKMPAVMGAALMFVAGGAAFAQTPSAGTQQTQQPQPVVGPSGVAVPGLDAEDLALKLANPVASMVSVPFQFNESHGMGPEEDGRQFLLNFQPVLPFKMNDDWNLILRAVVPIIGNPVLFEGGAPTNGIGDILFSGFISPNKGGIVWGVGPAFGLPVSSDPTLGTGKYLLGPTAVVLKQTGPWTYGALVNHVWSVGGDAGRKGVNQTFFQPFLSWGKKGWTLSFNTEAPANWKADQGQKWTVPIYTGFSKIVPLGGHPLSLGGGPRFYATSPDGGASVGFRFTMALLIPAGK